MSNLEDFAELLEKEVGKNDEIQGVTHWLDCGMPNLNKAISGSYFKGFPVGRMMELAGPPSAGKTLLATKLMISAQQAGGIAAFFDHERSFESTLAERFGLATTPGKWIYKAPRTFEDSCALAKKVLELVRSKNAIPPEAPIIIVFDSLASMVPKSKYAKDVEDHGMNDSLALARATSAEMPLLSDLAYFNNALLLFLNQTRDKIGGYVPTIETPGGNAPKFYSSVRVMLSAKKLVDKPTGENKGQEVTANVIKNKVARPFQKTSWQFVYDSEGRGNVDVTGSLLSHLIDEDVIKQNGPRIEWEGKNYLKHQLLESLGGSEKAFEVFKSMLKD